MLFCYLDNVKGSLATLNVTLHNIKKRGHEKTERGGRVSQYGSSKKKLQYNTQNF